MGAKRDIKTMLFRFVLVASYIVLGAAIFYGIEHTSGDGGGEYHKEVARKERLKEDIIRQFGINDSEYEMLVAKVIDAESDTPSETSEWSFSKGVDLSMQTVSTIGYGNNTPTTQAGKLFLIPFALFGIPLTVLLLNTIGENLSHLIRVFLGKFDKKVLRRKEVSHSELKCLIAISLLFSFLIILLAGVSTTVEDWTFGEGLYVWFVTFTTIGFGDYIPGEGVASKCGIGAILYRLIIIVIGLSLISTIFNTVGDFAQKRNSSAFGFCSACLSPRCYSKGDSVEAHEMERKKKTYSNNEKVTEKMEDISEPVNV